MREQHQAKGWWHTLPGILTAMAGFITAVTGLIVALHQVGLFDEERHEAPQVQGEAVEPPEASDRAVAPPPDTTKASPTDQADPYPLLISAGTEVGIGDFQYKILAARLVPYAPHELSLRFEVRMTNHGPYPANFWGRSFRLLVEGVPRAPENDLNELVDSHSAKEGSVEFVVPDTATDVGLQIGAVGEEAPAIPIDLSPPKS